MIQVRESIFETNSSSSHAIVIKKQGRTYTSDEIDRYAIIGGGELSVFPSDIQFGRGFNVLNSFYGKMLYAMAAYQNDLNAMDEIYRIAYTYIPGLTKIDIPKGYDGMPNYGHIDHQSLGLLQSCLRKHNISLEDFISSDRYIVIIDGDEYYHFKHMIDSGLINMDQIEEICD